MIGRADRWIRRTTIGCVAFLAPPGRFATSTQLPLAKLTELLVQLVKPESRPGRSDRPSGISFEKSARRA